MPREPLEGVQGEDGQWHDPATGRRLYPFTCYKCGFSDGLAAKSFGMEVFGHNSGGASCPQCGEYLYLRIVPDLEGDRMESESFEAYQSRALAELEALKHGTEQQN